MLTSLAFIFLAGLAMAAVCERIGLPRIIGMLFTGIVLGPYVLNLLDPSILGISSELRQMALIIILLKAGLSLNLADLKKVGRPAMMMAFVPASFEIFAFFLFAPYVLGITRVEAAVMGAVLGAVSPAVVIPRMVQLMENSYGTQKSIPQMIMAGVHPATIFSSSFCLRHLCAWRREEAQRRRTLCRFRFQSCSALCWEPLQAMCWRGLLKRHMPMPTASETA